jgi:hypothetical protein
MQRLAAHGGVYPNGKKAEKGEFRYQCHRWAPTIRIQNSIAKMVPTQAPKGII